MLRQRLFITRGQGEYLTEHGTWTRRLVCGEEFASVPDAMERAEALGIFSVHLYCSYGDGTASTRDFVIDAISPAPSRTIQDDDV